MTGQSSCLPIDRLATALMWTAFAGTAAWAAYFAGLAWWYVPNFIN